MAEWFESNLLQIFLGLLSLVPACWVAYNQYKKNKSDAQTTNVTTIVNGAEKITGTALELVEYLNKKNVDQQIKMDEIKAKLETQNIVVDKQGELLKEQGNLIKELYRGVTILTKQIVGANLLPDWSPPEGESKGE
jgi:hypothetical protein